MVRQRNNRSPVLVKGSVPYSGMIPENYNTSVVYSCVVGKDSVLLLRAVGRREVGKVVYYELFHAEMNHDLNRYLCDGYQYFTAYMLDLAKTVMTIRAMGKPKELLWGHGYQSVADCRAAVKAADARKDESIILKSEAVMHATSKPGKSVGNRAKGPLPDAVAKPVQPKPLSFLEKFRLFIGYK